MLFQLPKKLIKKFREPLGKIVKGGEELKRELRAQNYKKLICVGDFSNILLKKIGISADISILDGKIERKNIEKKLIEKIQAPVVLKAKNPPGFITKETFETVKLAFCYNLPVKIFVKGEDDLLFLPAAFFAPKNSIIIYGLRNQGGVVVKIEKHLKQKIESYLKAGYRDREGIRKEREIIAGGTFDRFHIGHKFFLLTGLEKGRKALVGITSKNYLKKWKPKNGEIFSFKKRKRDLKNFLSNFGFNFELFKIGDPFGVALQRGKAILVSKDTKKRAEEINKERRKRGLKPLKIVKVKTILAKDGKEISSSRIRNGEIDQNGRIIL
jgi:pantetheine-phosphate adenylyltransferase